MNSIAELESQKLRAVQQEDYDKAKNLKVQIDRLKQEALAQPNVNAPSH